MNIKNLQGQWKRKPFAPGKSFLIPKESGFYLLTNFTGDILYVGISMNLQRRFLEHMESNKFYDKSPLGKAYWFYYDFCEPKEHRQVERGLLGHIELHEGTLPWFNRVRAPS